MAQARGVVNVFVFLGGGKEGFGGEMEWQGGNTGIPIACVTKSQNPTRDGRKGARVSHLFRVATHDA